MALISAEELAERIDHASVRVVDVRWYLNRPGAGLEAFRAGHIPGAIFMDLDDDLSDAHGFGAPGRHPLPSPHVFRDRMMAAGIGSDDFVVAYDDSGGTAAARLWWMLDNLSHRGGTAVLDGGIQAWTAAGGGLNTDEVRPEPAPSLELAQQWRNVIDRATLSSRLGEVTLLDARAAERYRGEVEPIDPVAGHIPTAYSMPTSGNLRADGLLIGGAELRARFESLDGARPLVVYCGSGTTACHNVVAARVAGLPDPTLYVGSFSDWSRSGMPVATGTEPGTA